MPWFTDHLTREECDQRVSWLYDIIDAVFRSHELSDGQITIYADRIPYIVQGYNILNSNFKNWRITAGHRTEPPKIAALICLAILSIPPVEPATPANVTEKAQFFCAEIFAYIAAETVLGKKLFDDSDAGKNYFNRLLEQLRYSRLNFSALRDFIVDVNTDNYRKKVANLQVNEMPLAYIKEFTESDKLQIIALVNVFEPFYLRK